MPLQPLPDWPYELTPELSEALRSKADFIDQLFPADAYPVGAAGSIVPVAEIIAFMDKEPLPLARLRAYYSLLFSWGLIVDHHGWVFTANGGPVPDMKSDWTIAVFARVLRFLEISGWQGYSSSGYVSDYRFSVGLRTRLGHLWREQKGEVPLPEVWAEHADAQLGSTLLPARRVVGGIVVR